MLRYIDLHLQGQLKLDEMISARLPLERVTDALDALRHGHRGPQRNRLRLHEQRVASIRRESHSGDTKTRSQIDP
jgi:hypothetical protein